MKKTLLGLCIFFLAITNFTQAADISFFSPGNEFAESWGFLDTRETYFEVFQTVRITTIGGTVNTGPPSQLPLD